MFQQELQRYVYENTQLYGADKAQQLVTTLLKDGDSPLIPGKGYPYAGTDEAKNAWADRERRKVYEEKGLWAAANWTRTQTPEEQIYNESGRDLNTLNYHRNLADVGDPAMPVLPGGVGNVARLGTGLAGAYEVGKGVRQVTDGNLWEGAGQIVEGALMTTGSTWASKSVKPRLANLGGEVRAVAPVVGKVATVFGDGTGKMMLTTGTIGAGANASIQYLTTGEINPIDVGFAFGTGALTAYTGFWGTVGWNAGMGGAASAVKGDDLSTIGLNMFSAGTGAGLGYGTGQALSKGINQYGLWRTGGWDPKYNPKLQGSAINGQLGLWKDMKPSVLPGLGGNAGSAITTEYTNSKVQEGIKHIKEKIDEPKK
ncbi:hypothetical protein J8V57_13615 [Xenorhabdus sp. PB61.4]|uniref:hypothetical protein n=1 Tax=Xenorhabdus sp. PB61.4 TaxID=2788940 RepID=UPI001E36A08F|nr:hypothetical protein [Xenorhabdus sp. PB61.4]MCC8367293.1 hypothetical protein [Xenorhabdus sp. PB61.4]